MNPFFEIAIGLALFPFLFYPWFKLMQTILRYFRKFGFSFFVFYGKRSQLPTLNPKTEHEMHVNEIWKRSILLGVGGGILVTLVQIGKYLS